METILLLQQRAWRLWIAARAVRRRAQTTTLDAQRHQLRVRTQAERRRLQQAMPEAHTEIIDLTAHILVARDLDAYAPQRREAKAQQPRSQEIRAQAG